MPARDTSTPGHREPHEIPPVPDGELIGRLMRRFIFTAGITGALQAATLVIMTRLATV